MNLPEPLAQLLSHPDKLFYEKAKVSKLKLAEYYHAIKDLALPHLLNRPLSILRCPQGMAGKCFFQKHPETLDKQIGSVKVIEKSGHIAEHLMIKDEKSLIELVQFGALELHTWGCPADTIDYPDRMVFDLDPGPHVGWQSLIDCALIIKQSLDTLALNSFIKTSGKKGLHVFVPLSKGQHDFDSVKHFAKALADRLAEIAPDRYVSNMNKARRQGKIFIDYLRNEKGATCVAAYSSRANEIASVYMPISWEELDELRSSDFYTINNSLKRLSHLKQDPWQDYFKTEQNLPNLAAF